MNQYVPDNYDWIMQNDPRMNEPEPQEQTFEVCVPVFAQVRMEIKAVDEEDAMKKGIENLRDPKAYLDIDVYDYDAEGEWIIE